MSTAPDYDCVPEQLQLHTLTAAEVNALLTVAAAAKAIFGLPDVHPSDREEAARDIHNLQNRILARAAYARGPR